MDRIRLQLGLSFRTILGVLAVMGSFAALAYGLASAALLESSFDAQRSVLLATARGFAADFTDDALRSRSELQRRVDTLRDLSPELREATIYQPADGRTVALVSTSPARLGTPVAHQEATPLQSGGYVYRQERPAGAHLARLAYPLTDERGAPVAVLGLTYDLSPHDARRSERGRRLALMLAGLALALSALGLAILRFSSGGSLSALHEAAQRTLSGERGVRLGPGRRGEVAELAEDIDRLAEAIEGTERHVEALTVHDPLTGLLNLRGMQEQLAVELLRARRGGYRVVVVAIDVDYLERINQGWGEGAGDEALTLVAEKLASEVRPGDLLARVDADEYMLALMDTGGIEAEGVVARLREAVAGVEFLPARQTLTLSAGIAQFPHDAVGALELMDLAERAMRRSKTQGGNRASVFDPALDRGIYVPVRG